MPTFSESLFIENYKGAVTGALAAADSVSDKIVTAAFSIATAFGAIVALVTPKDETSGWVITLPFVFLALAVGSSLWAQAAAMPLERSNNLDTVQSSIEAVIARKRFRARLGLLALTAGMIVAGAVLASKYREPAKEAERVSVSLWLTDAGSKAIEQVCGDAAPSPLAATVKGVEKLSSTSPVEIVVAREECPSASGTLVLPGRLIAVARLR